MTNIVTSALQSPDSPESLTTEMGSPDPDARQESTAALQYSGNRGFPSYCTTEAHNFPKKQHSSFSRGVLNTATVTKIPQRPRLPLSFCYVPRDPETQRTVAKETSRIRSIRAVGG